MLRIKQAGIPVDVLVSHKKITDMLFFVLYDIESNKVRNQVSKYLLKKGCFRIQRSVFLAELSPERYSQIKSDLAEVQACYDNKDSILIVPVSTELLNAMKIIGKSINIDIITRSKNTLFFWMEIHSPIRKARSLTFFRYLCNEKGTLFRCEKAFLTSF